MKAADRSQADQIADALLDYNKSVRRLPGIGTKATRVTFALQVVDSLRRRRYVSRILARPHNVNVANPAEESFDPLKGAVFYLRRHDVDEAAWLVFLYVHFGRHARGGWRYARNVYGRLGNGSLWNWHAVSGNPRHFRRWLADNEQAIKAGYPRSGFGNHRKYISLDGTSDRGTGQAVESYVSWIGPQRSHGDLFRSALDEVESDAARAFDILYKSMDRVITFGRLAKFDYLSMIGELGIAAIEAGSTYLAHSSGPRLGAALLLNGNPTSSTNIEDLERATVELATALGVNMQVMEDALCNWQKSPAKYLLFQG